jgi:hypothetical protein
LILYTTGDFRKKSTPDHHHQKELGMNNTALRLVSASTVYFLSILLTVPAHALPPGSGSLYFVHNDASGTPQALTDEAGDVVWSAQTDPFGAAEVDEDPDGNG